MADKLRFYETEELELSWSKSRCIHFAACVRGLPEVFKADERPWIQPEHAAADTLVQIALSCPTGALHVKRSGENPEARPSQNSIQLAQDGPLYVQGDIQLKTSEGETLLRDTRVALCRCGQSHNKPFCDGSHAAVGFKDSGSMARNRLSAEILLEASLTLQATKHGPLMLQGPVTLTAVAGLTEYQGTKGALCRCGGSSHKPFCDGSHARLGFRAD